MHFLETSPFASLSAQKRERLSEALSWIKHGNRPPGSLTEVLSWGIEEAWQKTLRIAGHGDPDIARKAG